MSFYVQEVRASAFFRSLAAMALVVSAAGTAWLSIGYRADAAISFGTLYVVDSTGDGDLVGSSDTCDDGTDHCTLRAAIEASNLHSGTDGIRFNIPATDPGFVNGTWTISLPRALPDVTDSVNITGSGASLVVRANQGTSFSVFSLTGSAGVNLSGMTIENAGSTRPFDGGISNLSSGTVNVSNCVIRDNASRGVYNQGGASGATLNITACTITGNALGGLSNSSTMNVSNSTVTGNSILGFTGSNGQGTNAFGGAIYNLGTLTVLNSTLSDNSVAGGAEGPGGQSAGVAFGGAIFNEGTATVINSTLSGNSATGGQGSSPGDARGGGIFNNDGGAMLFVSNSTVCNNSAAGPGAAEGGGIYNTPAFQFSQAGFAKIRSTIIALNSAASAPDVQAPLASDGFNLIGREDGTFLKAGTDLTGTTASPLDRKLGPLQNNGGPTNTHALLPGSPAIDKGTSNAFTGKLTTDQRGTGFPRTRYAYRQCRRR